MTAKDGTIIEVFEWKSKSAMEQAHSNPVVLKMWEKYAGACEYVPVGQVEETKSCLLSSHPLTSVVRLTLTFGCRQGLREVAAMGGSWLIGFSYSATVF